MKRRAVIPTVMILALATGCDTGTGPDGSRDPLTVEARQGELLLANTGNRPVRWVAVVSGALVLLTGPEEWPSLRPDATARLPNEDLIAYTPDATHATVYWVVGDEEPNSVEIALR